MKNYNFGFLKFFLKKLKAYVEYPGNTGEIEGN